MSPVPPVPKPGGPGIAARRHATPGASPNDAQISGHAGQPPGGREPCQAMFKCWLWHPSGMPAGQWPAQGWRCGPEASRRMIPGWNFSEKFVLTLFPSGVIYTRNAYPRPRRSERMLRQGRRRRRCTRRADWSRPGPGRRSRPKKARRAPVRNSVPHGENGTGKPPSELSSEGCQVAVVVRVTKEL